MRCAITEVDSGSQEANEKAEEIDAKAEEEFKRTVLQIINCYRAKVELRVER